MGSIFLLLKSPVLLYWMYSAVHFTLLGGGICCIPLKNAVLCSSMYLFRQSLILLGLLLNFVRPGPEQSLAQSSFTLTVTRHLLGTAWPPVCCEVFRSQEPSVSSGLLPTALWRLSPTPGGPDPHTRTDSNPFSVSGASLGAAPLPWVSAPRNKTSRSPKPGSVRQLGSPWILPPRLQPRHAPRRELGAAVGFTSLVSLTVVYCLVFSLFKA